MSTVTVNQPMRSMEILTHGSNYRMGRAKGIRRLEESLNDKLIKEHAAQAELYPDDEDIQTAYNELVEMQAQLRQANLRPLYGREAQLAKARERRELEMQARTNPLVELRLNVQAAGEAYMNSLKRSGITRPDTSTKRQTRQEIMLDNRHNWYGRMMVLQLMRPMRQGVSATAVMQVAGMGVMLFALSPNFRTQVGGYYSRFLNTMRAKTQGKKDAKARSLLEEAEEHGGGVEDLKAKWRKRIERMQFEERGFRDPYNVDTAAMTEVALAESAYEEMRDPRIPEARRAEHIDEVQASYRSALSILEARMAEDGLDRGQVSQRMRMIVGHRMQEEPELASVFSELGHGRFERSEPRLMYFNGQEVMTWDGAFVDAIGGGVVNRGSFTPRFVGSPGEHIEACAAVLKGEMAQAQTLDDLNELFESYTAASLARRYPGIKSGDALVDGRITKAERMFLSMDEDGLSQLDQRYVYSESFVGAMEALGEEKPELLEAWQAQYGDEWRADIKDVVDTFSEQGKMEERTEMIRYLLSKGFTSDVAQKATEQRQEVLEATEYLMAHPIEAEEELGASTLEIEEEVDDIEFNEDDLVDPWQKMNLPDAKEQTAVKVKVMKVLDQLSATISSDLVESINREGNYIEGTFEHARGVDLDGLVYLSADVFAKPAIEDWTNPGGLMEMGKKHVDGDFGELTGPELATARRSAHIAYACDKLASYGVPAVTRDQMLSAAVTLGVERAMADNQVASHIMNLIDTDYSSSSLSAVETWRNNIYNTSLESTASGKDYKLQAKKHGYRLWSAMLDDHKAQTLSEIVSDAPLEYARNTALAAIQALTNGTSEQHIAREMDQEKNDLIASLDETLQPAVEDKEDDRVLAR